jgi:hypothetical protein
MVMKIVDEIKTQIYELRRRWKTCKFAGKWINRWNWKRKIIYH